MLTKHSSRVRTMDKAYIQKREQETTYQAKRRRGLFKRLGALAFIAIALGCIGTVTIYAQTSILEKKDSEKLVLTEQLQQLKQEEKRLHQDIKNYNDLDYIADVARRDYYLSKPGETLFKLPMPPSN